jgi:hypothetical protein
LAEADGAATATFLTRTDLRTGSGPGPATRRARLIDRNADGDLAAQGSHFEWDFDHLLDRFYLTRPLPFPKDGRENVTQTAKAGEPSLSEPTEIKIFEFR